MLAFEAVVVADDAAGFGAEFVGAGCELGDEAEFRAALHDVEDVGVVVEGVEAVRVGFDEGVEDSFGFFEIAGVVVEESAGGVEEGRGGEDAEEIGKLGVDGLRGLVEFLVGVEEEEVGHYVVREMGEDGIELGVC